MQRKIRFFLFTSSIHKRESMFFFVVVDVFYRWQKEELHQRTRKIIASNRAHEKKNTELHIQFHLLMIEKNFYRRESTNVFTSALLQFHSTATVVFWMRPFKIYFLEFLLWSRIMNHIQRWERERETVKWCGALLRMNGVTSFYSLLIFLYLFFISFPALMGVERQ